LFHRYLMLSQSRTTGPRFFLLGDFRQDQRADYSNSVGFNYYLSNGAQYTFNSHISTDAFLGYRYNKSDSSGGQGHADVDAYQASGFLNFHGQNWCVGGIVAYGLDEYDSKRHGILVIRLQALLMVIRSSLGQRADTSGGLATLPLVRRGLTFISVTARAYSEAGDPVLTQRQSMNVWLTISMAQSLGDGTTINPILPVNQHWNSRHVQNNSQNYG